MHYLDANATEPLRPEARHAVAAALDVTGNPSSVHGAGRAARRIMEDARELLAGRFGGRAADLVFTSGGTEADALAIHALGAGRRLIVGSTEHDAVRAAAPGAMVLPVDRSGIADLEALAALLADGPPALVCLMLANNETGVLQPVADAAALCRRYGARLHVDAVQAAGRMAVNLHALDADSLAISSHKLGGPAGAGALLLAPDVSPIAPLISGGGQERGRRGGTPPVAIIAGFSAAAAASGDSSALAPLRDAAEAAAVARGAVVCGADAPRLPNTTCLALPGVRADAQVIALDLAGVAVSAGAACSSGKVAASHVLQAMGLGPLAAQAIRVSLPWNATQADVEAFVDGYQKTSPALRAGEVDGAVRRRG
ncbi:MAG TPA: aminotransferase class V-fold PLP-dependent enzyme [Acetobacteraceae bacterium]|nr:aminotransferase class V-fold PLP-dependent enzyme [Acetobacteraceae bacterium]